MTLNDSGSIIPLPLAVSGFKPVYYQKLNGPLDGPLDEPPNGHIIQKYNKM